MKLKLLLFAPVVGYFALLGTVAVVASALGVPLALATHPLALATQRITQKAPPVFLDGAN